MSHQHLRQDSVMLDPYDWAQSSCVFDPGAYAYHHLLHTGVVTSKLQLSEASPG